MYLFTQVERHDSIVVSVQDQDSAIDVADVLVALERQVVGCQGGCEEPVECWERTEYLQTSK